MTPIVESEKIVAVLESVQREAQKRAKRATQRYGTLSTGDWHAQGDVMFIKLDAVPEGSKPSKPVAQLAPGTSRGSRHVIKQADLPKVNFFKVPKANALQGPILEVEQEVEVEHPDHGHVILPKGVYSVRYQRLYAPKISRVVD
jgi:hypothetical protein